jgi:hypothetical protein
MCKLLANSVRLVYNAFMRGLLSTSTSTKAELEVEQDGEIFEDNIPFVEYQQASEDLAELDQLNEESSHSDDFSEDLVDCNVNPLNFTEADLKAAKAKVYWDLARKLENIREQYRDTILCNDKTIPLSIEGLDYVSDVLFSAFISYREKNID